MDLGARRTGLWLPFPELAEEIAAVMREAASGAIECGARGCISLPSGTSLVSTMAADGRIAVHKALTANPANPKAGCPVLGGKVSVFCAANGYPLMTLDGPVLATRSAAAVSALAVKTLRPQAVSALVVGTGSLARAHVEALFWVNGIRQLKVYGRNPGKADRLAQFARGLGADCGCVEGLPDAIALSDLVLTLTSSSTPVVPDSPFTGQLVLAAGACRDAAAELPAALIRRAGHVVVDTLEGARSDAGDLVQAGTDWSKVSELSAVFGRAEPDPGLLIFKSVGHALWDLAAARLACKAAFS
jgi:1-piperideine-2-carboxylate/1-pyrroline-2-carboxylate reductase [NAD(P)H]